MDLSTRSAPVAPGTGGRRLALIINRHSRRGRESEPAVIAALGAAGFSIDHRVAGAPQDIARLIGEARSSVDAIVVGGGDGTLNAAAPGLLATGLPLGILPLGTANDLARTLALPMDIDAAVRVIAAGRERRIDIGEVNGHPYFNVASLGLGVDLTRALTRDAKKRWGLFGYAVAGLRVLGRLSVFTAEIEQDGVIQTSRTVHLAVGNGRHYGGGMIMTEDASIEDGRLDVYSLEVGSVWRLLRLLPALRSGRTRNWTEIRTLAGQRIEVRTRRPRSVNADGEIVSRTPAVFKVRPGAIRVFVP